jgi:hypothetical protein
MNSKLVKQDFKMLPFVYKHSSFSVLSFIKQLFYIVQSTITVHVMEN